MLDEANLDYSFLWKHVKAVRSEYRNRKSVNKGTVDKCIMYKAFLREEEMEINFDNLRESLKVTSSTDEMKIKSLPTSLIEEGGKMFVYLNSCPAIHWQNFYHHLFFEKTNSEMILSVLNAMKNSRTRGSRAVANEVLVRLADIFGFKFKYFKKETNWVNNFSTVKGI